MANKGNSEEEQSEKRVPMTSKVEPSLYQIVERKAKEQNRTNSNMIECLLKSHPEIAPELAEVVPA